ncbi:hypothetical protein C9374_005876 [Naegleria lovaniensis]|uniref:Uncharacterized protein n=1 Tax=Naegleria lovaniensis TaxID=51637 RepID=A0AA88KHR6_NAELO|nr:uncharacterized protein C9374_005876 [Naegleria lovaniensis]KAG2382084.1 hypothetical protein C9374_005876 [Naegleria lovaniensis]
MLSNDCCIGFRLWDFPLMYVQKPEGPYTNADTLEARMFKESFTSTAFYKSDVRDQENYSSHNIMFRTGKSIVFSMKREELGIYVQTLPLYVFLFILTSTNMDGTDLPFGWKPVLIGSVNIPLHDLKVFEEVDAPKRQLVQQKKTLSGTFTMKNDRGYDVAVIDMDVRLRQLSPQPGLTCNDTMTSNISKMFSLQRPLTMGGPNSKVMDITTKLQTGAVTRNPLLTVTDSIFPSANNTLHTKGNLQATLHGKGMTGEFGALSSMVQQYKHNQQQTKMMKGQIEAQLASMTAQLSQITTQLKEKSKKSKKSKVLYTDKKAIQVKSSSVTKKPDPSRDYKVTLEEELAERVIKKLQQQRYDTIKDDERQGTTLSGVIPHLTDTMTNKENESSSARELSEDTTNEYITIPCELYRTIKENNDRYNNLQQSYQMIMDEFMDNPSKLFSSMTKIDTRGMSLREKELWKNQNKLINLLKDNYEAIKLEKDLHALKASKQPVKEVSTPMQVEEVEESLTSSTITSARSERHSAKDNNKNGTNQRSSSRQASAESLFSSGSSARSVLTEPVVTKELNKVVVSSTQNQVTPVQESDDYYSSTAKFDMINEDEKEENQQSSTSDSFDSEALSKQNNQEPQISTSLLVDNNTASIAITDGSFEDFDGDFETSQTMEYTENTSETLQPTKIPSDTLRSDHDFAVVQVQNNGEKPSNTSIQEEDFEDFKDDEFDHHEQQQVVIEEEEDEDVTYEDQQEGHQEPSEENEFVHSIDYSGIEERTEEEDRI